MNELDRYAVSLENMEVLRAQVEEQAREIERLNSEAIYAASAFVAARQELAALKAKPSGVVLPDRESNEDGRSYPNSWTDHAIGWNACLRAVARLNQPARAALSANHSERVRVVPVEPTEAMRKAAQDKLASEGLIVTDWLIHTAYAAMLAAAPSAGSQKEQGE